MIYVICLLFYCQEALFRVDGCFPATYCRAWSLESASHRIYGPSVWVIGGRYCYFVSEV